ncbi:MAG: LuxR C-terminal-related transcriptional regulator [Frankiaceae bacterium]
MTTVLICDDERRYAEGLRTSVAAVPGVTRVTAVATTEELLARYASERPQLVLVAVGVAGGAPEVTRRLVMSYPDANVVVVATDDERDGVVQAIAGGARGFLHRGVSREELCATVAHALAGPLDPGAARPAREVPDGPPPPELTERELQVLRGMSEGKSNGQIGRELYLSEDTVKTHARRLFRKLGVNDRAQAVALGFRRGLVH